MRTLGIRTGRDGGVKRHGKRPISLRMGIWAFLLLCVFFVVAQWRGIALPVSWTERLLQEVAADWGGEVEAQRMSWTGGNAVVLHDVSLAVPGLAGHAERVELEVGWTDLVPRGDRSPRRRVAVHDVLLVPPGPVQEALGPLTVHRAELRLNGEELVIDRMAFSGERAHGTIEGRIAGLTGDVFRLDVRVQLDEWDAAAVARALETFALGTGEGRLGNWDGAVAADLRFSGTLDDLTVSWQASAEDVLWDGGSWYGHGYRILDWESAGKMDVASRLVTIERFSAQAARAGTGGNYRFPDDGLRRLEISGSVKAGFEPEQEEGSAGTVQQALRLEVSADGLVMQDDVPPLRTWGVSGRGQFRGSLEGPLTSPRLAGMLTLQGGTLWHQPFDEGQGAVEWSSDGFTVSGAEVTAGGSVYRINSHLAFGDEEDTLALTLESERGRAETLLAILGWDALPLQGTLDGFLRFEGPLSGLESYGSVTITDGEGWKQPFEEISAAYRWDERGLSLSEGIVRLGGGVGEFAGTVSPEGVLDLDVQATSLPLEALAAVENTHPGLLAGRADFRGSLAGTLDSPRWEGHVEGRRLRLGPVTFDRGSGYVALEDGGWEIRDLELIRPEGAKYAGSGWVNARGGFPPVMQLLVEVEGEGLEQVLEMLGVQLGYPLASGIVEGRAFLVGELGRPDGEVVLSVRDAELMGRPTGLAVELELAGGQVRVKDLSLGRIEA